MLALATSGFSNFGYLFVGLAMLAEGLTIPCPAVAVLLMAGSAVAMGRLSFWVVVGIAALSYSTGSYVPYLLGRRCTRFHTNSWAGKLIAKSDKHLERVASFFARYGEPSVALARPFWIGNYVSYFAGLGKMQTHRFLLFTFTGITVWSAAVVGLGQRFSKDLPLASSLIQRYSLWAVLIVLMLTSIYCFRRRSRLIMYWWKLIPKQ